MGNLSRQAMLGDAKKVYDGLSNDERMGLRKLRPAMLKDAVPADVESMLIAKNMAEAKLGGLTLTPIGSTVASLLPHGIF